MTEKPTMIEVRLNEWSLRDANPNVPWRPNEIADDAFECWQAGASIVHFHVRNENGSPAHDVELYGETIREIRKRCDILINPTMAGVVTPDPAERIKPLLTLCADPETRPDFGPLDMGSTNLDVYSEKSKRFTTDSKTYVNTVRTLRYLAEQVQSLGLKENMFAWTVPCLRTMEAFIDAGYILDDPAMVCIVLTEGGIQGGHPGNLAGLESMLSFMPQRNVHWSVCCREGNLFTVADSVLNKGGHIAIGLGDYSYKELGSPTNSELVRRIRNLAEQNGRTVATVQQTRDILNMRDRMVKKDEAVLPNTNIIFGH